MKESLQLASNPPMRLEGFLADLVSTLVNDDGRGGVEMRCLVPYIPASDQALEVWRDATKSYSKSYFPTLVFLCQLHHLPTPYVNPVLPVVQKRKEISSACKAIKDLSQPKGIDWSEAIWDHWISLEHFFGRNDDVQQCLGVIALQRRIEEERRRKAWATASYPYAYQRTEETALRARTQEAMEVGALTSTAGNGGVKRKREEEDIGEGFSVYVAKTVEEPAYPLPVPATALTPGGIEAQGQSTEPLKR